MKIIHCEQRTPEWYAARLGKPTASNFAKLLTPTGKPCKSADEYINSLIAERIIGREKDVYISEWMQRGIDLEPAARKDYEYITGSTVHEIGFALDDGELFVCSPDGLVADDTGTPTKGLEIKCPAPTTQAGYLRNSEDLRKKYFPQVQGCMLVMQQPVWDLFSYHPEMPHVLITVERDDSYIEKLEVELAKAIDIINKEMEKHQ